MNTKNIPTKELKFISFLRNALFIKIANEWEEKWAYNYGKVLDLTGLYLKNAFLEELLLDVEDTIRAEVGFDKGTELLISKDSLRRVLDESYIAKMHTKTKKVLAIYIGYKDWEEFTLRHPTD
jgi:hypothetical protein